MQVFNTDVSRLNYNNHQDFPIAVTYPTGNAQVHDGIRLIRKTY